MNILFFGGEIRANVRKVNSSPDIITNSKSTKISLFYFVVWAAECWVKVESNVSSTFSTMFVRISMFLEVCLSVWFSLKSTRFSECYLSVFVFDFLRFSRHFSPFSMLLY